MLVYAAEFYAWSCDREVTQFSLSSDAYPQFKSNISTWLSAINANSKCVSLGICCAETGKLMVTLALLALGWQGL